MRAPEAPIGWPMAMAPPLTLTLDVSQPSSRLTANGLGGEGFVGLDQVEVADFPAGLFQRLARGRDRARAHDGRIDAGGRPGGDAGERGQAALGGLGGGHQHQGAAAVIDARTRCRR